MQKLLTMKEAAGILAVSISTLRELVRFGEIEYIQRGRGPERRHLAFHPQDIEDYIKRSRRRESSPLIRLKTARINRQRDECCEPERSFLAQREIRLAARKAARGP